MSEDLIRRSDAIDALKNALCELGGDEWGDGELGVHADDIDAVINDIPTIEPKRGEWVFDEKGYFFCSECKRKPNDQYATTDFCPNCGADMREVRDE